MNDISKEKLPCQKLRENISFSSHSKTGIFQVSTGYPAGTHVGRISQGQSPQVKADLQTEETGQDQGIMLKDFWRKENVSRKKIHKKIIHSYFMHTLVRVQKSWCLFRFLPISFCLSVSHTHSFQHTHNLLPGCFWAIQEMFCFFIIVLSIFCSLPLHVLSIFSYAVLYPLS